MGIWYGNTQIYHIHPYTIIYIIIYEIMGECVNNGYIYIYSWYLVPGNLRTGI